MSVTKRNWRNKGGTGDRDCRCRSWKDHWLKYNEASQSSWPRNCAVNVCSNPPTVGAHIVNSNVVGEQIVPMCQSCNNKPPSELFHLKEGVKFASANTAKTCRK